MKKIVTMLLLKTTAGARPAERRAAVAAAVEQVAADELRTFVAELSHPRGRLSEAAANLGTAEWIESRLGEWGYRVQRQGPYRNLIALPPRALDGGFYLVGAHYDTVPGSPGADDNGSGVAAMLCCARLLAAAPAGNLPTVFVAFNAEEEGLLGSQDFAATWLPAQPGPCCQAHILEMVGYTGPRQRVPPQLPIELPPTGDFIGWLYDPKSDMERLLSLGPAYVPQLRGLALKVPASLAGRVGDLLRSDHAPLWRHGVPAVMWTDTAEFRNDNYHKSSDAPDTLDYDFLTRVTRLLLASLLQE